MKKVLMVMTNLANGGAERSLVNLLNELPADQYEIDLLLFKKEGMFLNQVPDYVNVINIPDNLKKLYSSVEKSGKMFLIKFFGTIVSKLMEKEKLKAKSYRWMHFYRKKIEILEKHYDVAFAYISCEVMYFVDEKVNADKKYVWVHNDYVTGMHPKKYETPYFERMNGIVSISQKCVDILKNEFPQYQEKIHYIENITSSAVIENRSKEFIPEEFSVKQCNMLSVGRLMEQKGFDFAIDAAHIMKKGGLQFQWYVIGNGELENDLKSQIKSKDVEDCFHLIGPRKNPYPYIANCTVFVQPSRWEGKSVVLDEAKILAKPILVTNYPTVHDQITDGKEGIIVDMTPEGIAAGIEKLVKEEDLRRALTDYLKEHQYGNQDEVKKYIELIG